MLYAKFLAAIVVILCLMHDQSEATVSSQHCRPANELTIYASDGINCNLFRSYYDMDRKNEERRSLNKRDLKPVNRECCRSLCYFKCGIQNKPACGEYAGSYISFINKCELRKAACLNGQAIIRVPESKCGF